MKKSTFFRVLSFLYILLPCSLLAQMQTVTGRVTSAEDGLSLIGVNIIASISGEGTVTDFDGNYTIEVSTPDELTFSYTGFKTEKISTADQQNIDVVMLLDSEVLGEVVVVGYGTQRTKDLTSSITTISAEDIVKTPTGQAMQSVQGKIAGVQIVNSGTPGGSPTVRIRGIGSHPGSGNTSPLYVVDGMFFNNIEFLNSADIESISVLKDASAAAIYGVRAANGVVLIETKSGKINQKAEIVYDGYYGTQVAQNVLKLANAEQFSTMAMESGSVADASFVLNAMQRFGRSRINPNVPDVNTDWYKEILRKAPVQNHSLTVRGGSEKASYSIAGSYFEQDGILNMKNKFKRINFRTKLDFQATDWLKIGGNMMMSNGTQFQPNQSAWFRAYFAVPILPVYDDSNEDAWPTNIANAQDIGYRGSQNPLSATMFNQNKLKRKNFITNFYAQLQLIPEKLTFITSFNQDYNTSNSRNVALPFFIGNSYQRADASVRKFNSNTTNQIWDNLLTYTDQINQVHNFQLMAGTSYRDESFESLAATGLNFPTNMEEAWYISLSEDVPIHAVSDGGGRQYGISYFSRLGYNYKHKYLFYGTFRADGSSKYQEKWGYFPTVGLGWVASEENFFNIKEVDYLKFKASWGRLGNDKVGASSGSNTTSILTTAIGDVLTTGTITTNTFSALAWEVVEESNLGLSAELFNNRLSLDADYFIRDTKNAVINVEIPSVGGSVRKNAGVIRNSGLEIALNWTETITKDFTINIGGNIASLKNEVRDLFGQEYIDGGSAEFRQRSIVGESVYAFFGREIAGVYQNQAEIDADKIAKDNLLEPGDLKYKDQNNDGIIDDDDRVILGSYLPSLTYGANVGMGYKNFDFSLNIFGQSGNKILNRKRGEVIFTSDTNMDADLAINRWHGEGTSDTYPSSKGIRKGWNQKLSDYFIEDGSFFRIQNVQVGYNIVGSNFMGADMPDMRISFTADKPYTQFDYKGFSPEVANGVDRQTYPIPASYTLGLNVKF